MKILIANTRVSWGGMGQYTINLAKSLKNQGCEIVGLVTHDAGERGEEYISVLDDYHHIAEVSKLRRYYEVARIINSVRPDILIVNYLGTVHYLLPFLRHCRVVSVIHSDQQDFYRIASIFASRVDAWVAPTPRVKEAFNAYTKGRCGRRITVIPHGVDTSTNRVQGIHCPNGRLKVIFIGALFRHKGVDLLPTIVRRLRANGIDMELVVLGDGELRGWLESELTQETVKGTVRIRGVVNSDEVRKELSKADVLLFPTRLEAFGLVIVEAMVQGVAPIVSHLPGITDMIVEHERTGYLVKLDDVDGFSKTIELLHKDRSKLRQIQQDARSSAQQKFSLDLMAQRYLDLFRSVSN